VSISDIFHKAKLENRAVLVGCMPAGFPTVEDSIASMIAMHEGGCDVIEVELPYSDPVMDGPVIQKASDIALAAGVRTKDTLRIIEAVAKKAPVVLMTYWNPIEKYGVNAFARDLAATGATGMITPDLIPDEAQEWIAASDEHNIDRTFLVSPSSTDERIAMTVGNCRGFVYATALMGVTGARTSVSSQAPELVERIRHADPQMPVGVGLGVGNGAQAAEVASFADGVIVGSALIRCVLDAPDKATGLSRLRALSAELADGVRNPRK
jgi:tryptophan synthase alpha chain